MLDADVTDSVIGEGCVIKVSDQGYEQTNA